jgi:lysophospholipase L1-like esterase
MRASVIAIAFLFSIAWSCPALSEGSEKWVTSWAASAQGPYPVGNAMFQPDLKRVLPAPDIGAMEQTFRLIVKPDVWGREARIRLSNAFGTKPVVFDGVYAGLQLESSAIVPGTNRPVTFNGSRSVTIAPGESAWSDAFALPFVEAIPRAYLQSRKLAISFHIGPESGPMTWHAKGMATSYVTAPGEGSAPLGAVEDEAFFPFATTSWYFLDALDVKVPAGTQLIVALGDSITDGTGSTLNGDDRWLDVLSRRLHARYGDKFAVVNAGIGGNLIAGPPEYSAQKPYPGGPAAIQRLERDVIGLSGVSTVIWFEGINDFSKNGNASVGSIKAALREGVAALRRRIPGVRVIGGTLTTTLGNSGPAHGFAEQDMKRQALNDFIRGGGLFDGVIDFDKAIVDPETGEMKAEFVPDSMLGGPGDKLHPNRIGYLAMGTAIDLGLFGQPPS